VLRDLLELGKPDDTQDSIDREVGLLNGQRLTSDQTASLAGRSGCAWRIARFDADRRHAGRGGRKARNREPTREQLR
jgi:hypothetical protein